MGEGALHSNERSSISAGTVRERRHGAVCECRDAEYKSRFVLINASYLNTNALRLYMYGGVFQWTRSGDEREELAAMGCCSLSSAWRDESVVRCSRKIITFNDHNYARGWGAAIKTHGAVGPVWTGTWPQRDVLIKPKTNLAAWCSLVGNPKSDAAP